VVAAATIDPVGPVMMEGASEMSLEPKVARHRHWNLRAGKNLPARAETAHLRLVRKAGGA
jgi:hypothetical protein